MRLRPAALFDMDGTLADVSGIRHHLIPEPGARRKDFPAFHAASVDVPAHDWVVEAARAHHAEGLAIIIVTARATTWRHHTAWWLALNGVPSERLLMRPAGDFRKDVLVKTEMLDRIRREYEPVIAYDDNPSIVALWESEGIKTIRVPGWEEL